MVTVLEPVNRVVSILATMDVSSPGFSAPLRAVALTQPHETRTLEMLTAFFVLFVTRKWCVRVGPLGTDPKSLLNSSKRLSPQVPALAAPAIQKPATITRLLRNMV